jgi:hypothetical protein
MGRDNTGYIWSKVICKRDHIITLVSNSSQINCRHNHYQNLYVTETPTAGAWSRKSPLPTTSI